ncbi:MAG: hypothetical protein IJM30_07025 [Thermoguttaceae bacterium]|nr:hypothetical protein [Thermoguttaceae bacterium]
MKLAKKLRRAAVLSLALTAFVLASATRSLALAPQSPSEEREARVDSESNWFRLVRENGVPSELQTTILHFVGERATADGEKREVSVDLIGAIHLADKEYYETLNEEFKKYETVVFEMVAAKGANVKEIARAEREKKAEKSFSPLNIVSISQIKMSEALGLVYQIDGIDYEADNLVRGDMDAEEFLVQLLANGDVSQFFVDAFYESFLDDSLGSLEGFAIAAALAKNRRLVAKRALAEELAKSSEKDATESEKPERENAVIHLRNKKAIEAVEKQLNEGKTKIALFYGAAHLPDLQKRLVNELNLKPEGEPRRIVAWRLSK